MPILKEVVKFCFPIQSASHLCCLRFICRRPKSKWLINPKWCSLFVSVCNLKREEASCLLLFQITNQNNQSTPFGHQLKKLTKCLDTEGEGNQIYLVTLRPTQLTQTSFLQKISNVAKWFFDIFNAEIAQFCQKLNIVSVTKWFIK